MARPKKIKETNPSSGNNAATGANPIENNVNVDQNPKSNKTEEKQRVLSIKNFELNGQKYTALHRYDFTISEAETLISEGKAILSNKKEQETKTEL